MEKKRFFNTKMIATTGILLAIEIVTQVLGNYVSISAFTPNLNFSLIIIALGAIMYGPVVGGFLGLVSGALTLFSPSTISIFFSISPVGTVLACLLKTTVAGVVAGLVSNIIKKKHDTLAAILASIIVPILNTGIFTIFCVIFFKSLLVGENFMIALWALIGFNFIIEIIITVIVVPSLYKVVLHVDARDRELD